MKAKIDYDYQNDSLYIFGLDRVYNTSFEADNNLILDLDSNGKINGLEFLEASKRFGISKNYLKNILKGSISILVSDKLINIVMKFKIKASMFSKETAAISIEKIKPDFLLKGSMRLAIV
jgi:uncharacterized protein YuzE